MLTQVLWCTHLSDAEAWTHFSAAHPEFANDARNVRIAMATDGFNPFGFGKAQYSCWPVFVIPLNLPPALCMKEENICTVIVSSCNFSPVAVCKSSHINFCIV